MNILKLFFQYFGEACLFVFLFISVRIIFEKFVFPLFCEHKYKICSYVSIGDETLVYIECTKCGKEKEILFDRKELEKWVK